jgi:8-oxo-dGTP pyrophosphatase MutT (NUDIX family)
VESNESPAEAAAREAEEETGLPLDPLQATHICVLHAATGNPPAGHIQLFVAFTNARAEVSLNRENSEFRWVDFEPVRLVSLEGQRRAVREIERVFIRGEPAAPLILAPPLEA